MLANIHPVCPIEEYVSKDRMSVWFKPPMPPHRALIIAIGMMDLIKSEFKELMARMGAIFCQVNRMKAGISWSLAMTGGNQKWKGATPNLRHIAITVRICKLLRYVEVIAEAIKIVDPRDWGTKYFTAASDSLLVSFRNISGM